MVEDKQLPSEFVSIRQIWMKAIDECRRAISQNAVVEESSNTKIEHSTGSQMVVDTVNAFYLSLVDYGQCTVRTEVDKYHDEVYSKQWDAIWRSKTRKPSGPRFDFQFNRDEEDDDEEDLDDNGEIDYSQCTNRQKWRYNAIASQKFYGAIIQALNKYGMLFDVQPKGFSNIEMESV